MNYSAQTSALALAPRADDAFEHLLRHIAGDLVAPRWACGPAERLAARPDVPTSGWSDQAMA